MPHTVAITEFEGPLGLLLELVERHQLEVTAISVAEVTTQYLERIRGLNTHSPEELSDFLQLGARLLHIKSLALLPRQAPGEQDEELRQLNLELEEYRRFQQAAQELARRRHLQTWQRPTTPQLDIGDLPLPELSLNQLAEAFTRALRQNSPAAPTGLIRTPISLETVLKRLRHRLANGAFELQTVLDSCRDRLEVIVTFLALLELIRDDNARVEQANQFAPIMIGVAHG